MRARNIAERATTAAELLREAYAETHVDRRDREMSSTRRSTNGVFHQESFCSAPEFEGNAINGNAAAKRIAILNERSIREVLWFIRWRSLTPNGLQQMCDELLSAFPERIGTPTL